jgi:uncharacterized protein YndB with AHSA1/START domain
MKCLLTTAVLAAVSLYGQGDVKVTKQSGPAKALIVEVLVPASRGAVWNAFATSEGLSTWLTPGAVVELRPGGAWTARYPGGKTGGGNIVDFTTERQMILTAMAPEQFPTVRRERTTAIFQFSEEGSATRVRLVQTGWKSGDEWDRAYEYLAKGNAQLLATLQKRFTSGPIEWPNDWVKAVQ